MTVETFDTHAGHHMVTRTTEDTVLRSAMEVMDGADALFDVFYPSSGYVSTNPWPRLEVPRVEGGVHEGTPRHKYVVRSDTEQILGLHSHSYPETAGGYRFIAEIADTLFPKRTAACTLFGAGEKVALIQHLGFPIDLGDGDVIRPEIIWTTSFNGQWATAVHDATTRFFCQNQLVGMQPLFKVKHTINHDILVEMRAEILEKAIGRAETLATMARVMKNQEYANSEFLELVNELVPKKEDMPTRAYRSACDKHDALWTRWFDETAEFGQSNRWLAYNAVQGAEQHVFNSTVKGRVHRDRALAKAIDGKVPLANRALTILTRPQHA
jgi:hypothetical protein